MDEPLPENRVRCERCEALLAAETESLKNSRRKRRCLGPQPVDPAEAPSPSPEKRAVTRAGGDRSRVVRYHPYNANAAENPMQYAQKSKERAIRRHREMLQASQSPRTSTGKSN